MGGGTAGITSIGAYIPLYRLSNEEIGRMWRTKGSAGGKAVAGYDEDSVTMAAAAALDCMRGSDKGPGAFYFASTTAPYREKQHAAVIAAVIDLDRTCRTADFANSLRAGTTALRSALDTVNGGSAARVLVAASDCRMGAPGGRFEQTLGDAAAAVMIGTDGVIADIQGSYSLFNDFTDEWRTGNDAFIRSGEGRFVDEAGYAPTMEEAISGVLKACGLNPGDCAKVVFPASDGRRHAHLARGLGFDKSQVQDPLFGEIGNTGTAAALLMLAAALEEASPGDAVLFANYGDGADAFVFRVTEEISRLRGRPVMKERLARKRPIDYGTYLTWRDLLPFEASSLPERAEPSLATRWRERRNVTALYGVKCLQCGTPQIHPIGQTIRVCAACQAKDAFVAYKFSDKTGKLFTYAVDHLQPTKNPPGLNGVVDFDGGGRLICELTDYDLDKVAIGMPVAMTFRKLSQGKGIVNYFWKATPLTPEDRA